MISTPHITAQFIINSVTFILLWLCMFVSFITCMNKHVIMSTEKAECLIGLPANPGSYPMSVQPDVMSARVSLELAKSCVSLPLEIAAFRTTVCPLSTHVTGHHLKFTDGLVGTYFGRYKVTAITETA